jgi:dihydropyrimidine dehydrogenase (NAD+) subunit PreA
VRNPVEIILYETYVVAYIFTITGRNRIFIVKMLGKSVDFLTLEDRRMKDWKVNVAGIVFKNPIIAAAGAPTINLYAMEKCIEAGVGSIATKSICFNPFTWSVPRPANFFFDKIGDPGSMTTIELGFWKPEQGERFVKEIKPIAEKANVRVIANINVEEFEAEKLKDLVKRLQDSGADMIEAACPCPIVTPIETAGKWYEENLSKVVEILRGAAEIPFCTKCPTDFLTAENIRIIEGNGADAIHFTPPPYGITVDIETGTPLLPAYGLYYNRGWRGVCSYWTYLLSTMTKLPVICSGGVFTGRDALERLMLGASLVGICTVVMYRGYKTITKIVDQIDQFMEQKKYQNMRDIIGIASPHVGDLQQFTSMIVEGQVPRDALTITVESEKCTGCKRCTVCTYGALVIEDKIPKIDLEICERCGVCESLCPTNAISITKSA